MAATSGGPPTPVTAPTTEVVVEPSNAKAAPVSGAGAASVRRRNALSVADRLYREPYRFDFFQAVRLMSLLAPDRPFIGRGAGPEDQPTLFQAHVSLSFPNSVIHRVTPPTISAPTPITVVTFLGMTGPNGVLPRHYTEQLLDREREGDGRNKYALRDWLDLFNHRCIALFYWAWEKYRFYLPYERGEFNQADPDPFTRCLLGFVGLGMPPLRGRITVSVPFDADGETKRKALARVDDLALLKFAGLLSHRPRNAVMLEAFLEIYFKLPIKIAQFQGQWLRLDPPNQSRLGSLGQNNLLGRSAVVGERVWSVESQFQIRIGPLSYSQFEEFLPDKAPTSERKTFFLLCHLTRLYAGLDLDFCVQLILRADEVPESRLAGSASPGSRLGWNSWVRCQPFSAAAGDAVFMDEEVFTLPAS